MAIAHSAFIDLENGLGSRVGDGWKRIFQPIQDQLIEAIRAKDWAKANQLVDLVNTDALVEDHFKYAETIAVASLLLGASRLVAIQDSFVAHNPPSHQIHNALTQWGFVVARNAVQNVRLSLHIMLARLEHESEQARHTISKDESNDPDQMDLDLSDFLRVIHLDGSKFMSLAANLMVSRLSSFGFLLEAQNQGIEKYEISAILDDHTCPVCEALDGQVFSVQDGIAQASAIMDADDADSLKSVAPWPSQSKSSVENIQNSDAQDLVDSGLALPPYHAGCRCITVDTDDAQDSSTASAAQDVADAITEGGLPNVSEAEINAVLGLVLIPGELEFDEDNDEDDADDAVDPDEDDVDEELGDDDDPQDDEPVKKKKPLPDVVKFDPWHDPKTGEFISGPDGGGMTAYSAAVGARADFADSITDRYNLTEKERFALKEYTHTEYVFVNRALRGQSHNDKNAPTSKKIIDGMDSLIAKGTLPTNIELYRGIGSGNQAEKVFGKPINSDLVGTTFTDRGFVSTSLKKDTALSLIDAESGPKTLVEIEAPKGMHAAANSLDFEFEKEIILPRGTTFRVKSVSTEDMESTVGTHYGKVRKIVVEPVDIAKSSPLKLVGNGKFVWEAGDIEI